jgi:hypothetical protein
VPIGFSVFFQNGRGDDATGTTDCNPEPIATGFDKSARKSVAKVDERVKIANPGMGEPVLTKI